MLLYAADYAGDVKRVCNQGKKAGADQIRPDAVKLIFCVFCLICYYLLNVTLEVRCIDTVKSKILYYNIIYIRKEKKRLYNNTTSKINF